MLGMYPGDPGPPGSDCAGIVMRAGSAVTGLQPGEDDLLSRMMNAHQALSILTLSCDESAGDVVFGLAHGCLGTVVATPAAMLAPMPNTLSFQEAATTPTVFITGLHC